MFYTPHMKFQGGEGLYKSYLISQLADLSVAKSLRHKLFPTEIKLHQSDLFDDQMFRCVLFFQEARSRH